MKFQRAIIVIICVLLEASVMKSQEATNYQWGQVNSKAEFAPRDGAGALVFNGKMWLLGGWNPSDKTNFPKICNNEVWSSTDGKKWELIKPNTFKDGVYDPKTDWEGRHTAGYVVYNGKMWIVGGDGNQGHYHYDVWNSSDGKNWTRVTDKVPWGPRVLHHTLVFKNKLWVMGGQTVPQFAPAEECFYRDIWTTADGVKWEKVEPKEPYWLSCGLIGGNVVFKGRMWVLGGATYDTPKRPTRSMYNSVWSSDDGIHWQCHVEHAPWMARDYQDVAAFDGKMWLLEGHDGKSNRNDVWYSEDGTNWHDVPQTPWAPRHAASVFVHDDALWMVTGNNMESDVWKLRRK